MAITRSLRNKEKIEELIDILKVWNIANGNTNMVALLEGEKSVDEYINQVASSNEKHLEELAEKREKEGAKESPNVLLIASYNSVIESIKVRQERLTLYQEKRKEDSE